MESYHVLIVDDQKDIRRVLAGGLQTLGHSLKVTEVPSAEEAILMAPRQQFDLIVTDVRLPGISGLDMVKRLRKFNPNIKIILLTGASDFQTRKQVEDAGTFAFFYKPIEMADFLDAVERALGLVATAFTPPPLSLEPHKKAAPALSEKKETPPPALPPDPPAQTPPAVPAAGVSAVQPPNPLLLLVQQLNLQVAFCLNIDGSIVLQAGESIEYAVENAIVTAALRVARSNTSLSHALGRTEPEYLLCIDGGRYHLCIKSVDRKHILLLVAVRSFHANLAALEQNLRGAIVALVSHVGPPLAAPRAVEVLQPAPAAAVTEVQAAVNPPEPAPEADILSALEKVDVSAADLAAIDNLFAAGSQTNKQVPNLDDFWNLAAEEAGSLKQNESHLTYDQARKLGLAPDR